MTEIDNRPVTAVSARVLREAAELVILTQFGSLPMLQKKFAIGLADARQLMDVLEVCKIVGPAQGALAREVLHRPEDADAVLAALPAEDDEDDEAPGGNLVRLDRYRAAAAEETETEHEYVPLPRAVSLTKDDEPEEGGAQEHPADDDQEQGEEQPEAKRERAWEIEPRERPAWTQGALGERLDYAWRNSLDFAWVQVLSTPTYVKWSAVGYVRLAEKWAEGYHDDYPQQIRMAKREMREATSSTAQAKAKAIKDVRRAEYRRHKKVYLAKTAGGTVAGGGAGTAGWLLGGLWVQMLLVIAVMATGAVNGRPVDENGNSLAPVRKANLGEESIAKALADCGAIKEPQIEQVRLVSPAHRAGKGVAAKVELPAGVAGSELVARGAKFASALRVKASRVILTVDDSEDGHEGIVDIWIADKVPFTGKGVKSPLLKAKTLNFWEAIPVGIDVRGDVVKVKFVERSILVGGEPGAGKSVSCFSYLLAACLDPRVELWLADGKGGGDLIDFEEMAYEFEADADPEEFLKMLGRLRAEMSRRYAVLRKLRRKKLTEEIADEYDMPQIMLHVDELAFYVSDEEFGKKITAALRDIVARGRAAGIVTSVATQRPSSDVVKTSLRDLLSIRWALRCTTPQASNTILGDGQAGRGFSASTIDAAMRGAGFLYSEGSNPIMLRSNFLEDEEVEAIARLATELRRAAGTLPAGADRSSVEAAPELPAVLALVREAFAEENDPARMTSGALVDYLARVEPDTWGAEAFLKEDEDGTDDEVLTKARARAVNALPKRLKEAVAGIDGVDPDDFATVQWKGGRGYHLATIKKATGEATEEEESG
ncbi:DNA translocase FtsK [Streptomyces violarus]|uniref:DNA translocase FtsK n=1 Tax=Streptomyces violarus TaxID=67380 RepID=UPI0021C1BB71|nr:DNA translocase FtsK [Streptomyces violarus]MCT9142424.1 FtsK/SpoIIIE domain-containing protein [Streptomyces violarus]